MESSIRVYRLKPNAGRKILFDILSTLFVTLFCVCAIEGIEYAGLTILFGFLSLWAGSVSLMDRRRRRVRFALYRDRIEWKGFWGRVKSAPLHSIGSPQSFWLRVGEYPRISFSTDVGVYGFGKRLKVSAISHAGWRVLRGDG